MRRVGRAFVVAALVSASAPAGDAVAAQEYAWKLRAALGSGPLDERFSPPPGFVRVPAAPESFGAWLRHLPLKPAGTAVLLHTGAPKGRQDVHAAVVDIDTGTRDLQQCADAVMRLYAEWRFSRGDLRRITFNDTGQGRAMPFSRWAHGERPRAEGRRLVWSKHAPPDATYPSFRRYMDTVFAWAGTHSLERQLVRVADGRVEIGDVIIKGGFPGHAVLVADVAVHPDSGERRFLLIQSYMPAQDMHVLLGTGEPDHSPWYKLDPDKPLATPEWTFPPGSLKRWSAENRAG